MAAVGVIENKPAKRKPVYNRPRKRRPDHDPIRWLAGDEVVQGMGTTYGSTFRTFSSYKPLPPIKQIDELSNKQGTITKHSLYRSDFNETEVSRPYLFRTKDKLPPNTDYQKLVTTYTNEFPVFEGHKPPALMPNKPNWDPAGDNAALGREVGPSVSTVKDDFKPNLLVKPRSPILHDPKVFNHSHHRIDGTTTGSLEFGWKYQPMAASYKPANEVKTHGAFNASTSTKDTYQPHKAEDYLKAFTEDEWVPEKKTRPRHMRSPASGQMDDPPSIDARPKPRRRTPPVVAPLDVVSARQPPVGQSIAEDTRPADVGQSQVSFAVNGQHNVFGSANRSIPTERQSMYATTYGDDYVNRK